MSLSMDLTNIQNFNKIYSLTAYFVKSNNQKILPNAFAFTFDIRSIINQE
jgi:hypothetical protein